MPSRSKAMIAALALALAACGSGHGAGWAAAAPADRPPAPMQQDPGTPDAPGMPPQGGIQGSSQWAAGEQRYDEVGYADYAPDLGRAPAAAIAALPAGSYVEVTLLDSGRITVLPVTGANSGGALVALSQGALQALGAGPGTRIPVRVRRVTAAPQDQAALAAGRPATQRIEAPEALLKALRRRLPGGIESVDVPPSDVADDAVPGATFARPSAPRAPGVVRPAQGGRFYVQVAALSNAANARALAAKLGGHVESAGGLHRVRLGPYASRAAADSARADIARRGYPDARVGTN